MGMTNDPDETAILDLGDARRQLEARLAADGVLCERDRAALAALDHPVATIRCRWKARRAFEAVMRNGISYYTRTLARDAGIAFVADGGQLTNVIQVAELEHSTKTRREDCTPLDAA